MSYKDPDKQREFVRLWVAKRKASFFNGKSCVRCGSVEKLELDHINPKDKVSHRIWSWSEKRRLEEIAKCQVLCEPCHMQKTLEDFPPNPQHGRTLYDQGCKCEICIRSKRECNIRYRKKKKQFNAGVVQW